MTLVVADRVKETTATTGTGALALAGAFSALFVTFGSKMAIGDTCYYTIEDATNNAWEVGLGTYSATNTLTRTTVFASSNAGAAVNFAAGTKQVWIDLAAAQVSTAKAAIQLACSDETTALTAGTAKLTFRAPYAMTLTAVRASLTTASSSGAITLDVRVNGTSIFSTRLTIDASSKTSVGAATAAVLSTTSIADDAEIAIDIIGAGTGATGLKLSLIGTRAA